jgi:hypothetical protein
VWKASRHGMEGERVHGTDRQVRWRCTSVAKSSTGTDAGARARGAVHGADKLGHEQACARGSRADAAPHGLVQVGHVCETRESGLTDGARLATR